MGYEIIRDWLHYISQGGIVMWPMITATIVLWYALGYRLLFLRRGSRLGLRQLINHYQDEPLLKTKGFIDAAVAIALDIKRKNQGDLHHQLNDCLFPLSDSMGRYRILIKTIVLLAPLAGLLGTVSGMIEMFTSLGNQTFYSQSGGVANGISQALFTTQFGLVIAIPGLIIGRLLDRHQKKMEDEIEQLKEYIKTQPLQEGIS